MSNKGRTIKCKDEINPQKNWLHDKSAQTICAASSNKRKLSFCCSLLFPPVSMYPLTLLELRPLWFLLCFHHRQTKHVLLQAGCEQLTILAKSTVSIEKSCTEPKHFSLSELLLLPASSSRHFWNQLLLWCHFAYYSVIIDFCWQYVQMEARRDNQCWSGIVIRNAIYSPLWLVSH